ncbi:MAG: hypothetical protein M1830_006179 [Pleopsidium flavum]|nr:MAG: hypothetical protein M1830_006179 [Pleopsidium flavum]
MNTLKPVASSTLDLSRGSYIYSIIPTSSGYAVISSDDSLRVFDGVALQLQPGGVVERTHAGVTSLKRFDDEDNVLATAGRDGIVKCWDLRTGKKAAEFSTGSDAALLSLECSIQRRTLVAGTEFCHSQASVIIWDIRNPTKTQVQYVESHSDDVTEIQYHPTYPKLLLSGSTDGLVNVYDTTIIDEEDALYQVINHGSSIHHAGFLSDMDVFVLSHDENLSMYRLADPDDGVEEPLPTVFGDLREPLRCEYVVDMLRTSQGAMVGGGSYSEHRLDLVPLKSGPQWSFDQGAAWRLAGAHGEEIVRSIYIDDKSGMVYTTGEDGCVRSWRAPDTAENTASEVTDSKASKRKQGSKVREDRYKPY